MSTGGSGPFFQNSMYVGNTFNAILYGVELVLYFQTMNRLCKGYKRHRSDKFFMFFSTMLLLCITIFMVSQSISGQEMWVINQNWPGGASAYFIAHSATWYQTFGTTACIVLQLMSDSLLIHRCWTVWCGNWKVICFPSILWLTMLGFGILELYVSGAPNANFFAGYAARVGLAYCTLTIALNVITTSIICVRIISYALTMRKELGAEFASTYFTAAAIIVESAVPYTLCGIAFLVAFGLESEFSVLLISLYAMFACVSPQMLILRVAEGRAWTRETGSQRPATIAFAGSEMTSELQSRSGATGDGGTAVHLDGLDLSQSKDRHSERSGKMEV